MALNANDLIEISIRGVYLAQQYALVFQYEIDSIPSTVSAVQLAEGWWNHVKSSTRALAQNSNTQAFMSILIRQLNAPTGDYAVYDIPSAENAGTRTTGTGDSMPPYVAVGTQLVVGSRVTRPGQKRHPFVTEGDNSSGVLGAALKALTQTWAGTITAFMTLGAPAATASLVPIVARKDAGGFVTAQQPVTGFIVNPNLTTQNSRKIGRGI